MSEPCCGDLAGTDACKQCLAEGEQCEGPCQPDDACEKCEAYWNRMRSEGLWIDGEGWTDKAITEALKG